MWLKLLAAWGLGITESLLMPYLWNGFIDPTTATDPDPDERTGAGQRLRPRWQRR